VFVLVIGIWLFISYVMLDPTRRFLMPPPQTVIATAFFQHYNLMVLLDALGVTTEAAMTGLAVSIAFGVTVAIVMSEAKVLERGLFPYLVVLQTIPILALVPLIGFWIGYGFFSRVVVCVLISVFPIMANTLFGLQSYASTYNELFELHRVGRWTKLLKLKLPMAMPAMFAGFRIAAGLSVVGEIVGGFFFQRGQLDLGALLDEFTARLNGPMLFGTIIFAAALGVTIFGIFSGISHAVVGRWKE
jgi:NitT/TauT family transport system permease protein